MKKILSYVLAAAMVLALAAPVKAQSIGRLHQNEFALSYGQISFPQTIYVLGEVLGVAFSLGQFAPEDTKFYGQFGVEYTHWVGRSVGLGLMAACDYMTSTVNGGESPDYNLFVVSALPVFKASWFNYPHVGMYSKIGAGVSDFIGLDSEHQHQFVFAFQLSPVCVDFGGEHFRGFVEIGYGAQGPCGGVKYVF